MQKSTMELVPFTLTNLYSTLARIVRSNLRRDKSIAKKTSEKAQ